MVLYQFCVFGADLKSNMAASSHKKHDLESVDEVCMEKIEILEVIRDKISTKFASIRIWK